jgi:cell division protein FtsQ
MPDRSKSVRRTMEIAGRRGRRRRRFILAMLGSLILVLLMTALYWFVVRDLSVVEIRDLEIRGLDTATPEGRQVKDAIEVATGEMTTLNVQQGLLDEEISRFPRIESATIETDFPNGATVTVSQREDGSIFGEDEDALLIADDGIVLGSPGDLVDSLPQITEGDPPENGRLEGISLRQGLILGAAPTEIRSYVDSSQMTGEGVEVTLSNGLVLLFGDTSQADEKWKSAAAVIADPELSGAGYVDLTVPRRPAVGNGDGPG